MLDEKYYTHLPAFQGWGGGGQKVTGSIRWAAYVHYNIIIIAEIIIQVDPGGWGGGEDGYLWQDT